MKAALPWLLLVALIVHVSAHLAIAIGFAKDKMWKRALAAFFVPPLAPVWAWQSKMKRRALAWTIALALYALCVAIA